MKRMTAKKPASPLPWIIAGVVFVAVACACMFATFAVLAPFVEQFTGPAEAPPGNTDAQNAALSPGLFAGKGRPHAGVGRKVQRPRPAHGGRS